MVLDRAGTDSGVNADMIEYWSGDTGQKWVRFQELMDASLAPLGERALVAAAPTGGERAIDVGCGCGESTIELARRMAPDGFALGVDISPPMLTWARARAESAKMPSNSIEFLRADAQLHAFAPAAFDVVYSRFGVMFFADPVAAFGNLRSAMKRGGRLAFVCWRPMQESTWFRIPLGIVGSHIPLPAAADPHEPGPFAFADPDRVRGILGQAGFRDIDIAKHDGPLNIARGQGLAGAVDLLLQIGPTSRAIADAEADDATKSRIAASLREGLAAYDTATGVVLQAATWIVSARAP